MDTLTKAQRSAIMSRIRGKDTQPELFVRRLVHRAGYRYRLHRRDLPGTPDLVFPSRRKVIFVHGCFWHKHPGCPANRTPASNRAYWQPKLLANRRRDRRNERQLRAAGWRVQVIWECETERPWTVAEAVSRFLSAR